MEQAPPPTHHHHHHHHDTQSSERPAHPPTMNQGSQAPNEPARPAKPVTMPCKYRTGRTLGQGTYAVVKEAVHIDTGAMYACKIISKKLMQGREHMVRNEIMVLKRLSQGHHHIVSLVDYFETLNSLYLITEKMDGGELFDRICAKGSYYERDAAAIIRTVLDAVAYLHAVGIVHRDLKPENLLFRTPADDSDLCIADFGLSRVMDEDNFNAMHTLCGTPGYMAPEIFLRKGHGKPVDIWAIGVIAFFLLSGTTPFDRERPDLEMRAIIAGDYAFKPDEYWCHVSPTARDFVRQCLTVDPEARMTVTEALEHPWMLRVRPSQHVSDSIAGPAPEEHATSLATKNLLPDIKAVRARQRFRRAALIVTAINRMQHDATLHAEEARRHAEADEKLRRKVLEAQQQAMDDDPSYVLSRHHPDAFPSPAATYIPEQ